MKKIIQNILILFSVSVMAQESVGLEINYQKGDRYRSKIVTQNFSMLSAIKSKTYFQTATVKEVSDNTYKLEIAIDRVLIKGVKDGKPIQYDSSVKELDPSVKGLHSKEKSQLSTVIAETVNKKGKTIKRTKVSGPLLPASSLCKTNLLELPNQSLKVDTEWDGGSSKNNIMTAYNYTVTKITDTTISIAVEGTQVNEYTRKPQAFFEGSIELDSKTGVPTKKNIKLYMGGAKKTKVVEVTITTEKI